MTGFFAASPVYTGETLPGAHAGPAEAPGRATGGLDSYGCTEDMQRTACSFLCLCVVDAGSRVAQANLACCVAKNNLELLTFSVSFFQRLGLQLVLGLETRASCEASTLVPNPCPRLTTLMAC